MCYIKCHNFEGNTVLLKSSPTHSVKNKNLHKLDVTFHISQIFPINVKGTAGSLVVLLNWLGAWIVSYTFNFLMSWSSPGKHKT